MIVGYNLAKFRQHVLETTGITLDQILILTKAWAIELFNMYSKPKEDLQQKNVLIWNVNQ